MAFSINETGDPRLDSGYPQFEFVVLPGLRHSFPSEENRR